VLGNGNSIDVQTRLSAAGATQLFVGAYKSNGDIIVEEYYQTLPGETMTRALLWGTQRAREFAEAVDHSEPATTRNAS
jgi:hypothetical protein